MKLSPLRLCTFLGMLMGVAVAVEVPFTPGLQKFILDMHNEMRKKQHGSNMNELVWDDTLAQEALEWISSCTFEHQMKGRGENLAFNTDEESNEALITKSMDDWYSEIQYFQYGNKSCSKECHFSQLVWAETRKVGCSMVRCPSFHVPWDPDTVIPNAWYIGCFYDPKGNDYGVFPWLQGKPCSHCLKGQTCSLNGLCHGEGIIPCVNIESREHCSFWYEVKECDTNPKFMHKFCRKACKICKPAPGEEDENNEPCEDLSKYALMRHNGRLACEIWRDTNQCNTNPFMKTACKKTCGFC
ncbi:serotriflin-like [Pecten maximus]|uniref:serotriflin-like n=1 Tax=Pecten maximus TaxID=6579 RepID=UPI001458F1C2|nr:serotriflin-like [Pecten maximus]